MDSSEGTTTTHTDEYYCSKIAEEYDFVMQSPWQEAKKLLDRTHKQGSAQQHMKALTDVILVGHCTHIFHSSAKLVYNLINSKLGLESKTKN